MKVVAYKDPLLPAAPSGNEPVTRVDEKILGAAVRTMYPHDGLDEVIYRRVVVWFDRLAAGSEKAAAAFAGFCGLLSEGPLPFWELSESYRVAALRAIEGEAVFFFVQRMAVRYLYDDVQVWGAFGYEGASVHLGGYVNRGFDDLDWLPQLPHEI